MTRYVSAAVAGLALASPSLAQPFPAASGATLLESCREFDKPEAVSSSHVAMGYCMGVVEAAALLLDQYRFCIPATGVTNAQLIRVVVRYIEDNPQKQHHKLAVLASHAFERAFPCPHSRK